MKTATRKPVRLIWTSALGSCAMAALFALSLAAPTFTPDEQPVGYVGQPAVTNVDVTSGKEFIFSIDYRAEDWRGNLHKYAISAEGTISDKDEWQGGAAAAIDAQHYDTERLIVTMNGTRKIPFRWTHLSHAQQVALDPEAAARQDATTSSLLNYLRGDRSSEAATPGLRLRSTVLGDIIHATPVYCPASLCTVDTVFVGANDGMLHAIDADTGRERFAYIPSVLIPKLNTLAAQPYQHRYFVDGRMALRKIGDRTLLVGSLGAGGKALYGIDVSHAAPASESAAAANLLWEITHASSGFANLGTTAGQPSLTKLRNGSTVLIVANGYGNSGNGHAVLYLIDPLTGEKIREIDTFSFGGSGNPASPNGLSSPTLWSAQRDGKIDTAYAGDLDGHLWQFNLLEGTAKKLFTTQPAQAITSAPALMPHPFGGAMVVFVTGRLLAPADLTDRTQHVAYGIWDSAPAGNTDLLEQSLTETEYKGVSPLIRVRLASSHMPDWRSGHHLGWRTPLPIGGERLVGDGALVTNRVFQFISTNPAVSTGENWWMQLNALTGGDLGRTLFDLNGDRLFTSADQVVIDKQPRLPVGRHIGGGTRSQMLSLIAKNLALHYASYDTNPPLITLPRVGAVPVPGVSNPLPVNPPKPAPSPGVRPGGAISGNTPAPRGEITQAEPLGRLSWREVQP